MKTTTLNIEAGIEELGRAITVVAAFVTALVLVTA